jgi:peptidoglycan/LPS O-acetylase OafA/YrhL
LITFLLLEETKRTGTIRIRKFYLRRVLRIWPLYYLIVALMLLRNLLPTQGILFNGLLYFLSIGATLLLSDLSYRYYESPFLRLKRQYRVVESSPR